MSTMNYGVKFQHNVHNYSNKILNKRFNINRVQILDSGSTTPYKKTLTEP